MKLEDLSRGLYEFSREYGMSDFAWINSRKEVFPIDKSIPKEEFHRALEKGSVYKLGRIQRFFPFDGDTEFVTLPHPEDSYKHWDDPTRQSQT